MRRLFACARQKARRSFQNLLRMTGQLKSHPLAELIREFSAAKLSGALRLERERAKSVVYFDAGEIIYAASNLRAFRLAECARRWKALSEGQIAGVQASSDLEFGAALVESGALSRERLDTLIAQQVSELLCHALMWAEGEWDFDPRVRLAQNVRVTIQTKKLLFETARRLPEEFIAARFTDRDEKLSTEAGAPDDLNLSPTEAFVLTRVDAPISINELLAVGGLPETETLRAIYTLALGGFVSRERWPQALSSEEIEKARAIRAAHSETTPTVVAQSKDKEKGAPQVAASLDEERNEQNGPDALFARLNIAANHYQVLGVLRSASAADIKRAYHALAKRFHPDRFRREVDAAELTRIESAFAQIAQAYETLKDKTSRAVYDSKLLKQEEATRTVRETPAAAQAGSNLKKDTGANASASSPVARPQEPAPTPFQAEEKFKQGLSALQQGNHAFAIASLGEAARITPNEPRYRADFGQALASDARLRHNAEAELKAAIALDAKNATYRVMLAGLYSEIGLVRRAQRELESALSIDPQDEAARRLLDKLKGS
jgi:curved DNA-binding protein CbpA